MSLPRAIGYVGIALLLVVNAFGVVFSVANHDLYGTILMVGFLGVLAFLGYGLWSAAAREKSPELKSESALGWYGEPISVLLRGPVLHTPEGLLVTVGSAASLVFAALAFFWPSAVALNPLRSCINATLFTLWPICLFVIYVKFCAPHFRPSIYTSLVMLCATGFPFFLAYK